MGINPTDLTVGQMQYLRIKDWLVDGAMADASIAMDPTQYQARPFHSDGNTNHRVHEGVPEAMLKLPRLQQLTIAEGVTLGPDIPVVTFVFKFRANAWPSTFMRACQSCWQNTQRCKL